MRSGISGGELTFRTPGGGSIDNWNKFQSQCVHNGLMKTDREKKEEKLVEASFHPDDVKVVVETIDPNIGCRIKEQIQSRADVVVLSNDDPPVGSAHNRAVLIENTQTWMLTRAGKFSLARNPSIEERWTYSLEYLKVYKASEKRPPDADGKDMGWEEVEKSEWVAVQIPSDVQISETRLIQTIQGRCHGYGHATVKEIRNVVETYREIAYLHVTVNEDLLHLLGNSAVIPDME